MQARGVAEHAVARLTQFNRRTLDVIAARIYFYYSLCYEQGGDLENIRRLVRLSSTKRG